MSLLRIMTGVYIISVGTGQKHNFSVNVLIILGIVLADFETTAFYLGQMGSYRIATLCLSVCHCHSNNITPAVEVLNW